MATVSKSRSTWTKHTADSLRELAGELYGAADKLLQRADQMERSGCPSILCRGFAGLKRGLSVVWDFANLHTLTIYRTKEWSEWEDAERSRVSRRKLADKLPKPSFPAGTPASCELYFVVASKDGRRSIESVSMDAEQAHSETAYNPIRKIQRLVVRAVVEIPLSVERPLIGKVVTRPQGVTPIKPFAKRGERCKEVAIA